MGDHGHNRHGPKRGGLLCPFCGGGRAGSPSTTTPPAPRPTSVPKAKVKVGFLYSATYMADQEQRALTISEVAVNWQETTVLQRKCGHPLPAITYIGPAAAASKHTTAPINHTRPSPRKHSPDVTTPNEMAEPDYCLLLIYRPRKNEWLRWPSSPVADVLPTQVTIHQLQAQRRTGKARQRKTDVLPLCYASGILIHPAVWPQQTCTENWVRACALFWGSWVPI